MRSCPRVSCVEATICNAGVTELCQIGDLDHAQVPHPNLFSFQNILARFCVPRGSDCRQASVCFLQIRELQGFTAFFVDHAAEHWPVREGKHCLSLRFRCHSAKD